MNLFAAQVQAFQEGLAGIEERHRAYLQEQALLYDESSARKDYLAVQAKGNSVSLHISEELPENIGDEVRELFNRAFN